MRRMFYFRSISDNVKTTKNLCIVGYSDLQRNVSRKNNTCNYKGLLCLLLLTNLLKVTRSL